MIVNPAVADWFFYERFQLFLKKFYIDILGAQDYWLRFEWQHRGSPHLHGLAWLPNVEKTFSTSTTSEAEKDEALRYINSLVTTINPAILADGSNLHEASRPHVCNKPYTSVADYKQDLNQLIATGQRHTSCSTAYCLRIKHGKWECRFGFPKTLYQETTLQQRMGKSKALEQLFQAGEPTLTCSTVCPITRSYSTALNTYATKGEPRSQSLQDVYAAVVHGMKDDDKSLKVVQKLLINATMERDYSSQETCHLLFQLPMCMAL